MTQESSGRKQSFRTVVCIDGSEGSKQAIRAATDRAQRTGDLLIGLSVIDLPGIRGSLPKAGMGVSSFAEHEIEEQQKRLEQHFEKNKEFFRSECTRLGISFEVVRRVGTPVEELAEECSFADLLFVASRLFFHYGSVGTEGIGLDLLFESTPTCPLVVVPLHYQTPKNILFGLNDSDKSFRSLKSFLYLYPELATGGRFYVTHVNSNKEEAKKLLGRCEQYLGVHGVLPHLCHLEGDPQTEVHKMAVSLKPSLIVLGASSKGFWEKLLWGSVARAILNDEELTAFFHL